MDAWWSLISVTSRVKILRSRAMSRLRRVGIHEGSISPTEPCLNITSMTLFTTSLSTGVAGRMS